MSVEVGLGARLTAVGAVRCVPHSARGTELKNIGDLLGERSHPVRDGEGVSEHQPEPLIGGTHQCGYSYRKEASKSGSYCTNCL